MDLTSDSPEPTQCAAAQVGGSPPPGHHADQQQWLRGGPGHGVRTGGNRAPEPGRSDRPSAKSARGLKEARIKKGKKKVRPSITQYYCGKCNRDGVDHVYEDCPKWRNCCFCDAVGHWSFHCVTLHAKCTDEQCLIQIGHRHAGARCPTSAISRGEEYAYAYEDTEGRVVVPESMFEDLNWWSFHESS